MARRPASIMDQPLSWAPYCTHPRLVPFLIAAMALSSGSAPKTVIPFRPDWRRAAVRPVTTLPITPYTYVVAGSDCSFVMIALVAADVPTSVTCSSLVLTVQAGQCCLTVVMNAFVPTVRIGYGRLKIAT